MTEIPERYEARAVEIPGWAQLDTQPVQSSPNHFSPDWFSGSSQTEDHFLADHSPADRAWAGQLVAQASAPPDVRSERIAAIQNAIANGTYQVSPEQTAEAILSEQHVRDGTAA